MTADHELYADWDAAYVLGALTPADRRAFEEHLQRCDACRAAVAEMAPMPGLLALARPVIEAEAAGAPAPIPAAPPTADPTAVPGARDAPPLEPPANLMERVARRDRSLRASRVRRLAVAAAGAAAAIALAVTVPAWWAAQGRPDPAETVALAAVADTPLTASVDLTPVAWGTSISMDCDYAGAASGEGPWVYSLVVTDTDGHDSQVATWTARAGSSVTLQAATAVPLDDIASIEVRSAAGVPLLAASLE